MPNPSPLLPAALAALSALGASAAHAGETPVSAPATSDSDEAVTEIGALVTCGGEARAPLTAERVVESLAVVFDERSERGRVRVIVDGISVARRRLRDLDDAVVELGRRGREIVVRLDEGEARIARLVVRYAPLPVKTIREPRLSDPVSLEWAGPTTRVATVSRAFASGDRLRLPAGGTGRRIREVRVRASALDFRSRLKLQGGGLEPITMTVARDDTVVFDTKRVPNDTEDLVLVVDLRRVRIDDVTLVYDPLPIVVCRDGAERR